VVSPKTILDFMKCITEVDSEKWRKLPNEE
jgi:hypothetical protein